jgi:hypothetical protein
MRFSLAKAKPYLKNNKAFFDIFKEERTNKNSRKHTIIQSYNYNKKIHTSRIQIPIHIKIYS